MTIKTRTKTLSTLFILFYFPPFSRAGSRRWAKHIKYFHRFGEKFHVLAGEFNGTSPWDADVEQFSSHVTGIPVKIYYPYFKRKLPSSLVEMVFWKMSLGINRLSERFYRGNYWDDSRIHKKKFLRVASRIVREKEINHLCISVGPFDYSTIIIDLKRKFPLLKVTIDFRDYWEDTFGGLARRAIDAEALKLAEVVKKADLVLAVNPEMCDHYSNKFGKITYCLPHCVDEDYQTAGLRRYPKNSTTHLRLIYGGSLYSGLEQYLSQLIELIKILRQKGYTIEISIYTPQPAYMKILDGSDVNFKVYKPVATAEFIAKLQEGDLILVCRPDWSPDGFSSKFYESIALRKPVLYIGPQGKVREFLIRHSLGYVLTPENMAQVAEEIVNNLGSNSIPNRDYPIEQHTFGYQTGQLIGFLERVYAEH